MCYFSFRQTKSGGRSKRGVSLRSKAKAAKEEQMEQVRKRKAEQMSEEEE